MPRQKENNFSEERKEAREELEDNNFAFAKNRTSLWASLSPVAPPRWKRGGIYTIQYLPARYITDSSKQRLARVSVHVHEKAARTRNSVHVAHVEK